MGRLAIQLGLVHSAVAHHHRAPDATEPPPCHGTSQLEFHNQTSASIKRITSRVLCMMELVPSVTHSGNILSWRTWAPISTWPILLEFQETHSQVDVTAIFVECDGIDGMAVLEGKSSKSGVIVNNNNNINHIGCIESGVLGIGAYFHPFHILLAT